TDLPAPPAAAPMAQPKRTVARTSAPSIISSDLVVNGTLSSTGDVQVDGRVEGDVHSTGLVIGEKAFIQGEVMAEDVTVRGRIHGSIRARKVLLCSTCHVEGNILHEAFAVEAGAFFEGNCRHSDNPLATEDGHKPDVRPASSTAYAASAPAAGTSAASNGNGSVPKVLDTPRSAATAAPLKSGA
ncbi:MAG TPA: polymer-forming cytoskeletal protein, partial [Rhizomicrobium sp.]